MRATWPVHSSLLDLTQHFRDRGEFRQSRLLRTPRSSWPQLSEHGNLINVSRRTAACRVPPKRERYARARSHGSQATHSWLVARNPERWDFRRVVGRSDKCWRMLEWYDCVVKSCSLVEGRRLGFFLWARGQARPNVLLPGSRDTRDIYFGPRSRGNTFKVAARGRLQSGPCRSEGLDGAYSGTRPAWCLGIYRRVHRCSAALQLAICLVKRLEASKDSLKCAVRVLELLGYGQIWGCTRLHECTRISR